MSAPTTETAETHPAGDVRSDARDRPSPRAGRRDVLQAMIRADLQARYGRGRWRLMKWVVDPFALVGVYLLLVAVVLDLPGEAPGLSIACAVIAFQLVTLTVLRTMVIVRERQSVILNMSFDRMLLPLASTLTEALAFGASLVLLALLMAAYGIAPTLAILWLPVVLALTLAVGIACAYPAALFGLWWPDMRPFAVSVVRAMYFLAPGLIPLSQIPGAANELVRINPLTGLFESYRDALLYGTSPEAWQLLFPLAFVAAMLGLFLPLYARAQRQFAKLL